METRLKSYSDLDKNFSALITLEGEIYNAETEDLGIQNPTIITHIYHKGKIVSSNKISYRDILNEPDLDMRLKEIVQRQQHIAIEALKKEKFAKKIRYQDYLKEIKTLLKKNSKEKALELLNDAVIDYPHNPIIGSYLGFFFNGSLPKLGKSLSRSK